MNLLLIKPWNDNTVKNKEIKEECDGSKSDGHIGKK